MLQLFADDSNWLWSYVQVIQPTWASDVTPVSGMKGYVCYVHMSLCRPLCGGAYTTIYHALLFAQHSFPMPHTGGCFGNAFASHGKREGQHHRACTGQVARCIPFSGSQMGRSGAFLGAKMVFFVLLWALVGIIGIN